MTVGLQRPRTSGKRTKHPGASPTESEHDPEDAEVQSCREGDAQRSVARGNQTCRQREGHRTEMSQDLGEHPRESGRHSPMNPIVSSRPDCCPAEAGQRPRSGQAGHGGYDNDQAPRNPIHVDVRTRLSTSVRASAQERASATSPPRIITPERMVVAARVSARYPYCSGPRARE